MYQLAVAHEMWRYISFRVQYQSRCATSVGGVVGTYIDYDSKDGPAAEYKDAAAMYGSTRCAPWKDFVMSADIVGLQRGGQDGYKYVRNTSPPGDLAFYDAGILYIYTSNAPGLDVEELGEVWLESTVEFILPSVSTPTILQTSQRLMTQWQLPANITANSLTPVYPFQSVVPIYDTAKLGTPNTTGQVSVPAGKWRASASIDSSLFPLEDVNMASTMILGGGIQDRSETASGGSASGSNYSQTTQDTIFDIPIPELLQFENFLDTAVQTISGFSKGATMLLEWLGPSTILLADYQEAKNFKVQERAIQLAERVVKLEKLEAKLESKTPTRSVPRKSTISADDVHRDVSERIRLLTAKLKKLGPEDDDDLVVVTKEV